MPAVLNAANEIAVDNFLRKKINFVQIPAIVEKVADAHQTANTPGLDEILAADSWARSRAKEEIDSLIG
jgi:1-deoxy-D-xylulose-5-phosphate reductoisomerase